MNLSVLAIVIHHIAFRMTQFLTLLDYTSSPWWPHKKHSLVCVHYLLGVSDSDQSVITVNNLHIIPCLFLIEITSNNNSGNTATYLHTYFLRSVVSGYQPCVTWKASSKYTFILRRIIASFRSDLGDIFIYSTCNFIFRFRILYI